MAHRLDDMGILGSPAMAATDGTPGNNQAQNKQVQAVCSELGLTKNQRQQLHREISGCNYNYQEIRQVAKDLFGK